MTPTEMRERRQALLQDARELHESCSGRDLTPEEQRQFDFFMAEADRLRIDASCVRMANADEVHASASAGIGIGIGIGDVRRGQVRGLAPGESFRRYCEAANLAPGSSGSDNSPDEFGRAIVSAITGEDRGAVLGTAAAGGFLVTPALSGQVIDLARSKSAIISHGAVTWPMPTSELKVATVTGDPTGYYVGEGAQITSSDATFGQVLLRARKLAVMCPISLELAQDSPNAASVIQQLVATAVAYTIDESALNGTGSGEEPLGILNHDGIGESAAIGTLAFSDMLDGCAAIQAANHTPRHFVAGATVWSKIDKMVNGVGEFFPEWPGPLKNIERVMSNKTPSGTALVADLTKVMLGVRQQIQIEVSRDGSFYDGSASVNAFERGYVVVRAVMRADIGLEDASAFYALTGIS